MHSRTALATLLLVSALEGHAQSLGAAQGTVIIGRPLDIVVQAGLAPGSDAEALCAQAEVRYGETRLAPSDISVSAEGAGEEGRLRVRTRLPVNEPFVTVELRVGCPSRFARSYTLLADIEPAPPPPASRPVASGRADSAAAASAPPGALPPAAPTASVRAAAPSTASTAETPIRSLATVPRPPGVARLASKVPVVRASGTAGQREATGGVTPRIAQTPAPTGPRLKLEPVDIGQGGPAAERVEPYSAAGAPASEVSAATPTATTPPPAPDAAALQQEVAALRAEQQRLLMAVESLNRELTTAREGRGEPVWPYALGGAAVVLLGVLAWWRRRPVVSSVSATAPWWATAARPDQPESLPAHPASPSSPQTPLVSADEPGSAAGASLTAARAAAPVPPSADTVGSTMAGLEVSEAGASVFQEVPVTPLDLAALHDLWNRVEFFESLGQIGDAIAALRTFVQVHPRACEAPYLRWWHLAQRHDRDPRSAQAMYEQHFQRLLPAPGNAGLEDDDALLAELQRAWPTDTARARIEAALASQPGDPLACLRVRTLAAFDDLITLHGVLDVLPLIEPAAVGVGGAAIGASGAPSMLDFELPDVPDLSPRPATDRPATAPEPVSGSADDGLDFHLDDWLPPAPPAPPAKP